MSLKESLSQSRIEFRNESIERERVKKNIEQEGIEARRKKDIVLNRKLLKLGRPYYSLIESSGCVSVLNELISLEKLTKEYGSRQREDIATPRIIFNYEDDAKGDINIEKNGVDGLDLSSLAVRECFISLQWDKRSGEKSHGTNYCYPWSESKEIKIIFAPGSFEVLGKNKEGIFAKENIDRKILEKSISRAYLNPIINN